MASKIVTLQRPGTDVLITGRAVTITPGVGGSAMVTLKRGGWSETGTISAATVYGPYNVDLNFSIIALVANASYQVQEAPLQIRIGT